MADKETSKKPSPKKTLSEFAAQELQLAGLVDHKEEEVRKVARDTMAFIKRFEKQNHTARTGEAVIKLFNELVHVNPIAPITDDPDEWERFEVSTKREDSDEIEKDEYWQHRRIARYISNDGGKTYQDQRDRQTYESVSKDKLEAEKAAKEAAEASKAEEVKKAVSSTSTGEEESLN